MAYNSTHGWEMILTLIARSTDPNLYGRFSSANLHTQQNGRGHISIAKSCGKHNFCDLWHGLLGRPVATQELRMREFTSISKVFRQFCVYVSMDIPIVFTTFCKLADRFCKRFDKLYKRFDWFYKKFSRFSKFFQFSTRMAWTTSPCPGCPAQLFDTQLFQ